MRFCKTLRAFKTPNIPTFVFDCQIAKMPEPLDRSLDEIIRNKKKSSGVSSNVRGKVPVLAQLAASGTEKPLRTTPDSVRRLMQALQMLEPAWKQETFTGGVSLMETGTRLYISNLEYSISDDGVKVLLSDVGELQRCPIHYDKSGRSKGTAEVVFLHQADALAAIKR